MNLIGALLPVIYAVAAFIMWYAIPKLKRDRWMWMCFGFGMFFIYIAIIIKYMMIQTLGFAIDVLLFIGGLLLTAFAVMFLKKARREEAESKGKGVKEEAGLFTKF